MLSPSGFNLISFTTVTPESHPLTDIFLTPFKDAWGKADERRKGIGKKKLEDDDKRLDLVECRWKTKWKGRGGVVKSDV